LNPFARRTECGVVVEGAPDFLARSLNTHCWLWGGEGRGRHEIQMMHGNVIDASSHIFSFIYVYAIELTSVILSERS
jgi:hypothetical protein